MFHKFTNNLCITILLILILTLPSLAQNRWEWPDKPENIKVLPRNITSNELRNVMVGFVRNLGVRCAFCHKGEEGKPLSTYDFPSDENPNKDRAREMIRMVSDIKKHLDNIKPSGDQRVEVSCYTCHHGRPRPMTLGAEISETYRKEGLDSALTNLTNLKEKYYGKGVYNFESADGLNELGQEVMNNNDMQGALRVFTLNTEKHPKASDAWENLAEINMKMGKNDEAIKNYKKALELNPWNRRIKEVLEKLEKK